MDWGGLSGGDRGRDFRNYAIGDGDIHQRVDVIRRVDHVTILEQEIIWGHGFRLHSNCLDFGKM